MKNLYEVRKDGKSVQKGFTDKQAAKAVRDELNERSPGEHWNGPHYVSRGDEHPRGESL